MTELEIKNIFSQCNEIILGKQKINKNHFKGSWEDLELSIGFKLCKSFKLFADLLEFYEFPGEFFTLKGISNSGSLFEIFKIIQDDSHWDNNYLPFYDIGNGDSYCLLLEKPYACKVYYFDHENFGDEYELEFETFSDWIKNLPKFFEDF